MLVTKRSNLLFMDRDVVKQKHGENLAGCQGIDLLRGKKSKMVFTAK